MALINSDCGKLGLSCNMMAPITSADPPVPGEPLVWLDVAAGWEGPPESGGKSLCNQREAVTVCRAA